MSTALPPRLPVAESSASSTFSEDHDHASIEQGSPPNDGGDLEKSVSLTRTVSEAYSVFSAAHKRWIVLLVTIASFFSPLSANVTNHHSFRLLVQFLANAWTDLFPSVVVNRQTAERNH
jgi:hypothetical protein